MNNWMKQSTCFILVLLFVAISCSPKATPTPTVVPPTQGPQLSAKQVVALVTDYLFSEATQDRRAVALAIAAKAEAFYIGNGVWRVITASLDVDKDGKWYGSEGRAEWLCFESTQKVVAANTAAQTTLIFLIGRTPRPPNTPITPIR